MRFRSWGWYLIPVFGFVIGMLWIWIHYRESLTHEFEQNNETVQPIPLCEANIFRCRKGTIFRSLGTGSEKDAGDFCDEERTGVCKVQCTSEVATLQVSKVATAQEHLCDPPNASTLETLYTRVETPSTQNTIDAGLRRHQSCIADGFFATEGNIIKCLMPGQSDRVSYGVLLDEVRCKFGTISSASASAKPQRVSLHEAIALWCERDGKAPDGGLETTDSMTDGSFSDGQFDSKSDGKVDSP